MPTGRRRSGFVPKRHTGICIRSGERHLIRGFSYFGLHVRLRSLPSFSSPPFSPCIEIEFGDIHSEGFHRFAHFPGSRPHPLPSTKYVDQCDNSGRKRPGRCKQKYDEGRERHSASHTRTDAALVQSCVLTNGMPNPRAAIVIFLQWESQTSGTGQFHFYPAPHQKEIIRRRTQTSPLIPVRTPGPSVSNRVRLARTATRLFEQLSKVLFPGGSRLRQPDRCRNRPVDLRAHR